MSEDRPAISTPRLSVTDVARKSFGTVRRGFDPEEVRLFLEAVAEELMAAEQREDELQRELAAAEEQILHPDIDEATLSAALGQRSAAVLRKAHEEAGRIIDQAEAQAAAVLRDAHQQATEAQVQAEAAAAERIADAEITTNALQQQAHQEATHTVDEARAEGDAIVERAREQGRAMLDQAQEARRRVLADMAQRRRAMTAQIDQYRAARDEVAAAVVGVRHSVDRIVGDLARADDAARTAAAEVAHRHPIETTEHVLVAEAEQAAAELGTRTGTPADLEATRPVRLDEIRTEVPFHEDLPEEVAAWDAGGQGFVEEDEDFAASGPWGTQAGPGGAAAGAGGAAGAGSATEGTIVDFDELGMSEPAQGRTSLPASGLPPVPGTEELFGYRQDWEVRIAAPEGEAPDDLVAEQVGEAAQRDDAGRGDSGRDDAGVGGEPDGAGREPAADTAGLAAAPAAGHPVEAPGPGEAEPADAEPADADSVEGLFARLRASRTATDRPTGRPGRAAKAPDARPDAEQAGASGPDESAAAPAAPATATAAAGGPSAGEGRSTPEGDGATAPENDEEEPPRSGGTPAAGRALARRAELLDPVTAMLARRLKRALQDDQNRLLERLRSGTGEWTDELLPPEDEQRELYAGAALPHVREAVAAGIAYARSIGRRPRGKAPAPDDQTVAEVAEELGSTVATLLRRRLTGEDIADPVERVGAAYREWRGERIERLVGDSSLEAFSAGVLAALPPGSELRWIRDEDTLGCADCEDNALGEAVPNGEEFPTGHLHPPAHPGCRCLVLPTPT